MPIEGPQIDEQFWLDQLPEQTVRFGFGHAKAFVPTRWLEDGDHVQVGNVDLEVLHYPGHTPGHVVFFDRGSPGFGGRRAFRRLNWKNRFSAGQSCRFNFMPSRQNYGR